MNNLIISLLLLFTFYSFGQKLDKIDPNSVDKIYLEHLVKTKIDEVRKGLNLTPLVNDSILYVAADHHAEYMKNKGRISHYETDSVLTKTPQDRGDYFGAINYGIGENVMYTDYNGIATGKKGKEFDTRTYDGLAASIVNSWVNSLGHYKNIITDDYEVTGVSVAVDTVRKRVYACQKFAEVYYKYYFEENKNMFPYSKYAPPTKITSFDGVDDELIEHTYQYGLKHDKLEECEECLEITKNPPFFTLRVERNYFILKVENANYIKNLMDHRKDGFAVEIVTFDDYMCSNPDYYIKPSRRNGQLKLNGSLLEPVYRKDLFKGYKKRKPRKDVKFIPYIFKSDSISFFKRFGRYKLDRHTYEYYEVKLGKIPRDLKGYWAHNLVYIQKDQICHIDYFTGYCGDLFEEYMETEFIPASSEGEYNFLPERESLSFTVPFEQGESDFTKSDIAPFISSLSDLLYKVDSVQIDGYSSIEGDSIINNSLQVKRAESIMKILQQNQLEDIPVSINTFSDWKGFRHQVKKSPKFRYLSGLSDSKIIEELQTIDHAEIEPILEKSRRGEIYMYCTIDNNEKNIEYFVKKELKKLYEMFSPEENKNEESNLNQFNKLYTYIHHLVVNEKLSPEILAEVKMPKSYDQDHSLVQKYILYGYEFKEYFKFNKHWVEEHENNEQYIISTCEEHIEPEFVFIIARNAVESYIEQGVEDVEKIQNVLNHLSRLESAYGKDSTARLNIDRLNFNLNIILLNKIFKNDPMKYSGNAMNSIAQLNQFYERYEMLDSERIIKLAKAAVFYEDVQRAVRILQPYAKQDSVLAFMMPLKYHHPSSSFSDDYYQELINLSSQMDTDIWCNMFMGKCKIPFQVFDHEELRNVFCKECMAYNELLLQFLRKEKVE
ncbi:MAG: CAP domain-containing protein [Brumimicrobium sp.]